MTGAESAFTSNGVVMPLAASSPVRLPVTSPIFLYVHGTVTPLQGITSRAGSGVSVQYNDGSNTSSAASLAASSSVAVVFASYSESEGSDLSSIDLRGASLPGSARIHGADLTGADLRQAMLRRADLGNATLAKARAAIANDASAPLRK